MVIRLEVGVEVSAFDSFKEDVLGAGEGEGSDWDEGYRLGFPWVYGAYCVIRKIGPYSAWRSAHQKREERMELVSLR